jgi:hypothetical protein
MKNTLAAIVLIIAISAPIIYLTHRQVADRVEQSMRADIGVLCGNGYDEYCYVTTVWKDREIIKSWYDNPNTITDSIKNARIKEGLRLLNNTKSKTTYK